VARLRGVGCTAGAISLSTVTLYHIYIVNTSISDKIVCVSGFQTLDGTRLKELRQMRMYSQLDLSKMTGVTQASISNLERGERQARPRTVRRLAEALGVEPRELVAVRND
jgi:DNA-binding XRE family transcriptional regulator